MKCCGITRIEDALQAAYSGFDAIGLVFAHRSKRCISLQLACDIRRALPPMVTTVALFMDNDAAEVERVNEVLRPDLLQFHGTEQDLWCAQFQTRYIKSIAMGGGTAALPEMSAYPGAAALLLDGHAAGQVGGRGDVFDWSLIPDRVNQALILAGGLNAGNVAEAVRVTQPWAVDVSSGVESSPGIKDAGKMYDFVAALRTAAFDSARPA